MRKKAFELSGGDPDSWTGNYGQNRAPSGTANSKYPEHFEEDPALSDAWNSKKVRETSISDQSTQTDAPVTNKIQPKHSQSQGSSANLFRKSASTRDQLKMFVSRTISQDCTKDNHSSLLIALKGRKRCFMDRTIQGRLGEGKRRKLDIV